MSWRSLATRRIRDPYATAIGTVSINLAYLEWLIDMILMDWTGIDDDDVRDIILGIPISDRIS
jgi:hypothetical protein